MNVRGRPPLNCDVTYLHLTLCLRSGRDDDLIAFFDAIPVRKRSIAVRAALRAGGIMLDAPHDPAQDGMDDELDDFLFG